MTVDFGPQSRLLVTYERAGNLCVLPCRYVGEEPNGDLLVEVERVDTVTGAVRERRLRRIEAAERLAVEEV